MRKKKKIHRKKTAPWKQQQPKQKGNEDVYTLKTEKDAA